MIDRRYLSHYDWLLFGCMLILAAMGLMTVMSATYKLDQFYSPFFKKQCIGTIMGILLYGILCCIDYRTIQRWCYLLYFLIILFLILTLLKGTVSMGGQRWINLGLFKFQPSECAKLLFAPYFSYYLMTEKEQEYTFKTFIPVLISSVITFLLIVKQPDLGTGLIFGASSVLGLWLAGIGKRFFVIIGIIALLGAPLLSKVLKPYQMRRVAVFLGEGSKAKERYQLEQSKIAIGSGGVWGKGFLQGTQNKLCFLPEGRTDCIFAVWCEEWGLLGALLLLIIYGILFLRVIYNTYYIPNRHAQLLVIGLLLPLILSAGINMGMVMGLLPIVGIPLPFMTYGLSHLWMSYVSLGIMQSVFMRRFLLVS